MKKIQIEIRIDELTNQMATAVHAVGYAKDNLCHQLELLGVLQNTVHNQEIKLGELIKLKNG